MGGYGSGQHKRNGRIRLSGLPKQGEAQQPNITPWLRFSASEMKRYGACVRGTEYLWPFAGAALHASVLQTAEALSWPTAMKDAVEKAVALSETDSLLWVRSYCEGESKLSSAVPKPA